MTPIYHLYKASPSSFAVCGVQYRRGVHFASDSALPTCPKCLAAASPERLAEATARYERRQVEIAERERVDALWNAQSRAGQDLEAAKDAVADTVNALEDDLRSLRDALTNGRVVDIAERRALTEILDSLADWKAASQRYADASRARASV